MPCDHLDLGGIQVVFQSDLSKWDLSPPGPLHDSKKLPKCRRLAVLVLIAMLRAPEKFAGRWDWGSESGIFLGVFRESLRSQSVDDYRTQMSYQVLRTISPRFWPLFLLRLISHINTQALTSFNRNAFLGDHPHLIPWQWLSIGSSPNPWNQIILNI